MIHIIKIIIYLQGDLRSSTDATDYCELESAADNGSIFRLYASIFDPLINVRFSKTSTLK